jgi:hypothetical protein
MAHAYTTKRGKNKKSKLGVRKDQQQNSERSIKSGVNLNAFLYDGPKEPVGPSIGRLSNHSINTARLENVKSRLQKAIMDKCSNPSCENVSAEEGSVSLSECSACHQARYCCKECQKAHWPEHKVKCKEIRKALEQEELTKQQTVLQALH